MTGADGSRPRRDPSRGGGDAAAALGQAIERLEALLAETARAMDAAPEDDEEQAGPFDDEDLPLLEDVVDPGETIPFDFAPAEPAPGRQQPAGGRPLPAGEQRRLIDELRELVDEGLSRFTREAQHALREEVRTQIEEALGGARTGAGEAPASSPAPAPAFTMPPMDKTYDPHAIEERWYRRWEEEGHFRPSGEGPPYCIMLPPPNVTGSLHMGHAFQDTLMDALVRYHRMRGFNTLWQCGTDHAGIATQMVVERQLAEAGSSRLEVGRERFVEEVWRWKEQSGGHITRQLRRLGASMDWSRERFTLEADLSRAVTEVFVRLHDEGLIYRGKRLVNWDPVLHTAISDLEVVSEEEAGHLWHIRYPLADGSGHLGVATTRPETMLGDTAVAVHPEDARYRHLVGRSVTLPLTGRSIPVIADAYVDPEFGSGCVKITPGHDFNDYAVGERHDLPVVNVFTENAAINDNAPAAYVGLDRYEARRRIVADLEAAGLLERVEEHRLVVPRGDRSHAVIEPYLTDQWFVRIGPLAEPAVAAVQEGRIRFVPENWAKTYYEWMRNIQDWCISRQLWWGHRIPAWYDGEGRIYVGRSEEEVRARHGLDAEVSLEQDPDVLDTWFSSGLWPFSTLGWPEDTPELRTFYPTSVLVTGFDIIFFWVARMIMMGLKFAGDVPFREVYIHGLVRDSDGHKMSKSRGNILDPLDLIEGIDVDALIAKRTTGLMRPQDAPKIAETTRHYFPDGIPSYGTDALRYTFASLASPGRNVNFDLGRIEGYRNFCNKIWNAARYVLMSVEGRDCGTEGGELELGLPERWITSRLQQTLATLHEAFASYRFDLIAQGLYEFVWNEYCDWYLELSKAVLNDPQASAAAMRGTRRVLVTTLETTLRAAHPLMPFITEEIWQRVAPLAGRAGPTISRAPFPDPEPGRIDEAAVAELEWLKSFVLGVRRIRAERDLPPSRALAVRVKGGSEQERAWLDHGRAHIEHLARVSAIAPAGEGDAAGAASALAGEMTLLVPLADLVDRDAELARLDKTIGNLERDRERVAGKLANRDFLERAPAQIVDKERARLEEIDSALARLREQRAAVERLPG